MLGAMPALGAKTAVFPVEESNLTARESSGIAVMIASKYEEVSGKGVIFPRRSGKALGENPDYPQAARALGVHEYLVISAVGLDAKIALKVERFDQSGRSVHKVNMSILGLDDMEEAGRRIGRALFERKTPKETREIDTITSRESKVPNRVFVDAINGIKVSYIQIASAEETFTPSMRLQYDLRLETERAFFEFGVGAVLPSMIQDGHNDVGGLMLEMGGARYLLHETTAPYVGAGVSPRLFIGGGANGIGLAPYGSLGVMFMRQLSTRLYAEARVYQNLLAYEDDSNRPFYPTEFTFEMGIGW